MFGCNRCQRCSCHDDAVPMSAEMPHDRILWPGYNPSFTRSGAVRHAKRVIFRLNGGIHAAGPQIETHVNRR